MKNEAMPALSHAMTTTANALDGYRTTSSGGARESEYLDGILSVGRTLR